MPDDLPTRGVPFGRYRLLERLGVGGMAIVYRAVVSGPKNFSRTLVIKRIIPHLAHDPSFVTMLAAEARLAALLLHPNIVQVHEFGDVDGECYLAMELVDGFDLHALLRQARQLQLRPAQGLICYVMSELCSALAYAHSLTDEAGRPLEIVHRDVTPSNIMVTRHGGLKLVDFGIAKASEHATDEQTRTGTLKGKVDYMSPEQIHGQRIDGRTDIFALGVVLYECLTLRRPFHSESEGQTMRLICDFDVSRPSRWTQGIDPELEAVVMRMLARDRDQRYATAEEVARALAPIARRLGGGDAAGLRELLAQLRPPTKVAKPLSASDVRLMSRPAELERTPDGSHRTPGGSHGSRAYIKGELVESEAIVLTSPSWRRRSLVIGGAAVCTALAMGLFVARGVLRSAPGPAPTAGAVKAVATTTSPKPLDAPKPLDLPKALDAPKPLDLPKALDAPKPPPQPRAIPEPSKQPVEAAAPQRVRLRVRGTDGADVLVDGVLVGRVPLDLELGRKPGTRAIYVRKAGFGHFKRDIDGQENTVLAVDLARAVRPPAATKKPRSVIADPFAAPR